MDVRLDWDSVGGDVPFNETINLRWADEGAIRDRIRGAVIEHNDLDDDAVLKVYIGEVQTPYWGTIRRGAVTINGVRELKFTLHINPRLIQGAETPTVQVNDPEAPNDGAWGVVASEDRAMDSVTVLMNEGGTVTYRRAELADKAHLTTFDAAEDHAEWLNGEDLGVVFNVGEYAVYKPTDGKNAVVQIIGRRYVGRLVKTFETEPGYWSYRCRSVDQDGPGGELHIGWVPGARATLTRLPDNIQNLIIQPQKG